ncbi:MAG: prolyl-tRNA synthetase associated domain-containing protein [Parcubacteria group bacterium]|jgi:Ala-tRNA(Pro) deacylase
MSYKSSEQVVKPAPAKWKRLEQVIKPAPAVGKSFEFLKKCMADLYEQKLYKILDEMNIPYEKFEHPAFGTVEASGSFYRDHDMGVDCKNAFMQNRRGRKHYLVILCAQKNIDIPHLAEFLGEHRKMGFASADRLENNLGLTPGSVTPFGLIHENAGEVGVVVDKEIFDYASVHFHPFRNTASLKISTKDFLRFLKRYAMDVKIYDTELI